MKERTFYSETSPLRALRRIRKPDVSLESSLQYLSGRTKRTLDLAVGSLGLPVGIPIIFLAAGVNKLLNPHEPALYRTERVGRGGRKMPFVKLRSMRTVDEAETVYQEIDPRRISWFGRLLRRGGIDELPKIFLLLSGEMSAVGPRPMGAWEMERMQSNLPRAVFEDWKMQFMAHRPGGTGLYQIFGSKDLSCHQRARLDRFYATHASLGLDLYILFASTFALIRGKGIR